MNILGNPTVTKDSSHSSAPVFTDQQVCLHLDYKKIKKYLLVGGTRIPGMVSSTFPLKLQVGLLTFFFLPCKC